MFAQTKLHPPLLTTEYMPRTLLKLASTIEQLARCTVIHAPTGYGKTTLVAQWLSEHAFPYGWLSLQESDNDLSLLATCLIQALQRVDSSVGRDALTVLDREQPDPSIIARLILNSMVGLQEPFVLVLDDYHHVQDGAVHELITALIEEAPSVLHLVITTRHEPAFPARWKVRGWLHEVKTDQLRLSTEEATRLLNGTLQLNLADDELALLNERAEGWIAGLKLAALALPQKERHHDFIQRFRGSHQWVTAYLMEEALARQSLTLRAFLRDTALLPQLSASLCDAVTGRSDSAELLRQIESNGLFLTAVDESRIWYRYHPLFADALTVLLTSADKVRVLERAANWYAQSGLISEAVDTYLRLGRADDAARLVARQVLPSLVRGDHLMLRVWLTRLALADTTHLSELHLAEAWFHLHSRRADQAQASLDRAERLLPTREVQAWVDTLRALAYFYQGEPHLVLPMLERAQSSATDDLAGMITWISGLAQWQLGQASQAVTTIRQALSDPRVQQDPFGYSGISYYLSNFLNQMGRRREALAVCERVMGSMVDEYDNPLAAAAMIYVQSGILYYEADLLDEAAHVLRIGQKLAQTMGLAESLIFSALYLALIDLAHDAPMSVETLLFDARAQAIELNALHFLPTIESVEAQLWLRSGQQHFITPWMNRVDISDPSVPGQVQHVYISALIFTHQYQSALTLLDSLEESVRRQHQIRSLLSLLTLRALALDGNGQMSAAIHVLRETVQLAAPHEYRRVFLDVPTRLLELLNYVRETDPAFIDTLVAAPSYSIVVEERLADPLTGREIEIVHLVAEGYSNREIAAKLFVAPSTIKTHIKSAYSKLGADSRTRAIVRARSLGLLKVH